MTMIVGQSAIFGAYRDAATVTPVLICGVPGRVVHRTTTQVSLLWSMGVYHSVLPNDWEQHPRVVVSLLEGPLRRAREE